MKSKNQLDDLFLPHSSSSHELIFISKRFHGSHDPIETNPSILHDNTKIHKLNIKYDLIKSCVASRDTFHPLSFTHHGPHYFDSHNQFAPLVISLDTFYFQFVGSHDNQVQGGHFS